MKNIADFLFEARMLKEIPRSGYQFLGSGSETVAEHSYMISIIAYVMSAMHPEANALKLTTMCLIHDLPEARTGDLNYVQKQYVEADEKKAMNDLCEGLSFGGHMKALLDEFNEKKTLEAKLAKDADQIAFILDLKNLKDKGYTQPDKWLPFVEERLVTETGKKIAREILTTDSGNWWISDYSE